MSGTTLRATIAVVLLFHGVGHLMGLVPGFRLFGAGGESGPGWLRGWSSYSWMLTAPLGDLAARIASIMLYGIAFVGFTGAGMALLGWLVPPVWWRSLAIVSAVVSLVAVMFFWQAFIYFFPHKVGAIGVNVAVLICLLWTHWPAAADLGY